ncbi:hypothetical protein [Fusobacterium sp. PH5-44]|uniref:hypothetical protein n=1 Tax=unclassified Fusobacterium TaxID=2648384 RepID=UPI003D216E07
MTLDINRLGKNTLFLSASGLLVLITQKISKGASIIDSLPGMAIIIVLSLLALIIKELFPKSFFPAFGWVTILGFVLSIPYNPLSVKFLEYVNKVDFMAITTPLLAFAGISVGNKITDLKKMSWKVVLIAVVVFVTIFFACALIAQTVLKLTGKI